MKHGVSRAFMVGMLTDDQLNQVHDLETKSGRCLLPWEVVSMFFLDPVREHYNLPGAGSPAGSAKLSEHCENIHRALVRNKCFQVKTGEGADAVLESREMVTGLTVAATHSLDWNIRKAIELGEIDLYFKKGRASKSEQSNV